VAGGWSLLLLEAARGAVWRSESILGFWCGGFFQVVLFSCVSVRKASALLVVNGMMLAMFCI